MDGRNDKIIPIILRPCALPVQYQMYHKVVYDPRRKYVNFWDKILRVTFDLKDVPDSLKEYKFFLSSDSNSTEDSSRSGHYLLILEFLLVKIIDKLGGQSNDPEPRRMSLFFFVPRTKLPRLSLGPVKGFYS